MILRCTGKEINGLIGYLGTNEIPTRIGPSAVIDVSSPFYTLGGENEVKGMTLVPDTGLYYLSDRDLPVFKNRIVAKTGDLSDYANADKFKGLSKYFVESFTGSTLRVKNTPEAKGLTKDAISRTIRPVEIAGKQYSYYKSYQATTLAGMLEYISRVKYIIAVISNDAVAATIGTGVPIVTVEWYNEHFKSLLPTMSTSGPRLVHYSSMARSEHVVLGLPMRCLPESMIPFNTEPAKFYIDGVELTGSICDTCTECSDRKQCPSYSSMYPQSHGCAYKRLTSSNVKEEGEHNVDE